MTTTTIIRTAEQGETTWFFNSLMTTKASSAETAGAYSLTEHVITPASTPPMHVQNEEDEAFYVLDGEVRFTVDGETVVATPGTFAFVARGSAHSFETITPTSRMLVICSGKPTDNLESFFLAMGTPAPARVLPEPSAPDLDKLAVECARTKIDILV